MSKKFSSSMTDHAEWLAHKWIDFLEEAAEKEIKIRRKKERVLVYKFYAENAGSSWSDVSSEKKALIKYIVKSEEWYELGLAKMELLLSKAIAMSTNNEPSRFLDETIARVTSELADTPRSLYTTEGIDELAARRKAA